MNNIKGVAISLKKRTQNLPNSFSENYKYIVFGHYDGMDIIPIKGFGEFRPANIADKIKTDELCDGIIDKYTIKAWCIPSKKYDYDYTIVDKEYPFVSCIMFHLSKECIRENSIEVILKKISVTLDQRDCENVKYEVYCSIGYADIIILVHSKNFDIIGSFVSDINSICCENNNKWVSAVYTIVGYEKKAFYSVEDIKKAYQCDEMQKNMGFCVSLGLHPGFSFDIFKMKLVKSIKHTLSIFNYDYQGTELANSIWTTFGNIDVIFNLKLPVAIFPALYSNDCGGVFVPGSELFDQYIASIKVAALFNTEYQKVDNIDRTKYDIEKNTLSYYKNFLSRLSQIAEEQNLPKRMVAAVKKILELYKTLAEQPHGFEVKRIIGNAIAAFIENMELSIEMLKSESDTKRGQLIVEIEEAVGEFRNYIVTYLSDLHRSERSFIEGRTMTHPSIGALTKLLFSYNVFINDLAEKYKSDKEKYAFVIVSGGCDQTQVYEVFRFIGAWKQEYIHLFIISIPEISLFDIGGTFFRLAHECFHCFGNRYRKERKYYVMRSWASFISENISEKVFNPLIYHLPTLKLLKDKEIEETRIAEQKNFSNKLNKILQEAIEEIYEDDKDKKSDEDFYADKSIDFIKKQMGMCFVCTKEIASPEYVEIIQDFLLSQSIVFRKVIDKVTKVEEKLCTLNDTLSEIEYYMDNNVTPNDMHDLCTNMFNNLFSSILAPHSVIISDQFFSLIEHEDKTNIERRKIDNELCRMLEDFPGVAMNAVCECFADCYAIKELSVSLAEFLFAFVYETRDINKAMPLSINNILRIGVDLSLMYDIQNCLSDAEKKSIEGICKKYNDAKFDVSVNIQDYIERINIILDKYQRVKSSGDEIIEYLKTCGIQKETQNNEFSSLYAKFNNPEQISENDIYSFMELWTKLAEEE